MAGKKGYKALYVRPTSGVTNRSQAIDSVVTTAQRGGDPRQSAYPKTQKRPRRGY
jgi:hypothetical protein